MMPATKSSVPALLAGAGPRPGSIPQARRAPMSWFEEKGFKDKGVLLAEELHKAEIHHMQLRL